MKQSDRFAHDLSLRIVKLVDACLMTAVFAFIWYRYLKDAVYGIPFYRRGNYFIIALYFVFFLIIGRTYSAFLISYQRISEVIYSQFLTILETDVVMYLVAWLMTRYLPRVSLFLRMLLIQLVLASLWALFAHKWYFHTFRARKSVVIWEARKGLDDLVDAYGLDKKFKVEGNYFIDDCLQDLSMLDAYEVVFLSGIHSHERNIIIKYCIERKITAFIIPRVGDILMSGARRMHMFHLPIMRLDSYNPPPEYLFFKRLFDIVLSALAIAILSPVFLVTALLIKTYDGGPVLYRQRRLTKGGREFDVLKFRSMCVDAESDGVARLSTGENDDRITLIGRKIRAVRIDELPQFFNVLGGSMSLVGPRPERPEIAAEYEEDLPEFRLRLQAKAGLTGYAQVYGKYNSTPYDKLEMDLMYMANPSLAEDFKICLATLKILVMKESTEGIAVGQVTAEEERGRQE